MPSKSQIEKDTIVQILARYVHLSAHLRDKYPNFEAQKATLSLS